MTVLFSTLQQMGFLMLLIAIGFFLARRGLVPSEGAAILSKMENYVFIPALALGTFMSGFTPERLVEAGGFFVGGAAVVLVGIPLALLVSRLCSKDAYVRNLYTYALAFPNFGFMGNAVVMALFPDVFMEYLIFVLPFWICIFLWGVPYLLTPSEGARSFKSALRNLANPMIIAMLVGIVIGLTEIPVPSFLESAVTSLGNCMSPVAMLLTGLTVAKIDLKASFTNRGVYLASAVRLVLLPLLGIGVLAILPVPYGVALCAVCALAMPLGLNVIVIPGAFGKDTSVGASMALVSHILSCVTIPPVFMLFSLLIKG